MPLVAHDLWPQCLKYLEMRHTRHLILFNILIALSNYSPMSYKVPQDDSNNIANIPHIQGVRGQSNVVNEMK